MNKKLQALAGVGIALSLAACTTPRLNTNTPDPAAVRLAQVAESIQKHDNDLNDIEMTRYVEQYGERPVLIDTSSNPALNRVVSLGGAWHGPLDRIIMKLSELGGLDEPRFIGVKPSGDVLVNVNTNYRRIIDMLHDAGSQAGSRAKVTLKMKEKLIEVEYRPY